MADGASSYCRLLSLAADAYRLGPFQLQGKGLSQAPRPRPPSREAVLGAYGWPHDISDEEIAIVEEAAG